MCVTDRYEYREVHVQRIRFSYDKIYFIVCKRCNELIEAYSFRELRFRLKKHYKEHHKGAEPIFVPSKFIDASIF